MANDARLLLLERIIPHPTVHDAVEVSILVNAMDETEVGVVGAQGRQTSLELCDGRFGIRGPGVPVIAVVGTQMHLHVHVGAMPADSARHRLERRIVRGHIIEVVDAGLDGRLDRALNLVGRCIVQAAGTQANDADLLATMWKRAIFHDDPSHRLRTY